MKIWIVVINRDSLRQIKMSNNLHRFSQSQLAQNCPVSLFFFWIQNVRAIHQLYSPSLNNTIIYLKTPTACKNIVFDLR